MGWWRQNRPVPQVADGIDAHYRRIVARGDKQLWSDDDMKRLQAKVARLVKGDEHGDAER